MNNALCKSHEIVHGGFMVNHRTPVIPPLYQIPGNIVYTCLISGIVIIMYLIIKRINILNTKNMLSQKHNIEITEQIELLKKRTTELDKQLDLLKPQITELNTHNHEMLKRYETTIQEFSELVGLFVEENYISTKIQTTVSNITKYFEFFDKLHYSLGYGRFDSMFGINSSSINGRHPGSLEEYKHIINLGLSGQCNLNPFIHTPIMMKHFSKYYNNTHDRFYPLPYKAWGGEDDNSPRKFAKLYLNFDIRTEHVHIGSIRSFYPSPCIERDTTLALLNRGIVQLLHETDEEFELKLLENILIKLEDYYVIYKQYEMIGITNLLPC